MNQEIKLNSKTYSIIKIQNSRIQNKSIPTINSLIPLKNPLPSEFFCEVFQEMSNFGEIEDMVVVDNISEHMLGNVYIKYYQEEDAEKALESLTGRYYEGHLIQAEFSPVSDFRESRCRQFHESKIDLKSG
jgi:hypothetical protein